MRRYSLPIGILAIACGLLVNAVPARAQSDETWVSRTGNDITANNCAITAPCRTFQFAHNRTNPGGAINVLSSGNFGPVNITKSISIVADGVEAVINTSANSAAINVNGANIVVSLRGLTIDLRGTGANGIAFLSGAALHVHNCVVRRANNGIAFTPASGTAELYVVDSVTADMGGQGIGVQPVGSSNAKVIIDHVRVENTRTGIVFSGGNTTGSIIATVRDSVSAGNSSNGIQVAEDGSGSINVMVDRSSSVNNGGDGINGIGISAQGAGATIRIGDSTVSGNSFGLSATSDGVIASYGTNKVDGNGFDGAPTTTVAYR